MATRPTFPARGDVTAVILAGGRGERLGGRPKALLRHAGRTLIEHAAEATGRHAAHVIACLPDDLLDEVAALVPGVTCIAGGASRQRSLLAGLGAASTSVVLVHEVARPFLTDDLPRAVLAALGPGIDGAVPVAPVTWRDSLVRIDGGRIVAALAREDLRFSMTPQAYRLAPLLAAVKAALAAGLDEPTCQAPLLRAGGQLAAVEWAVAQIKITYPEDLALLDRDSAT